MLGVRALGARGKAAAQPLMRRSMGDAGTTDWSSTGSEAGCNAEGWVLSKRRSPGAGLWVEGEIGATGSSNYHSGVQGGLVCPVGVAVRGRGLARRAVGRPCTRNWPYMDELKAVGLRGSTVALRSVDPGDATGW